jgi:hypothetical protein
MRSAIIAGPVVIVVAATIIAAPVITPAVVIAVIAWVIVVTGTTVEIDANKRTSGASAEQQGTGEYQPERQFGT